MSQTPKPSQFFSDHFGVPREAVEAYGAFNVSLIADLPLFVDPFLLFSSTKPRYRQLHDDIIDYLRFLRAKASTGTLDVGLQRGLYSFNEVKQNWLGFSRRGNQGSGLGRRFAAALHNNLHTIFANFGNEGITQDSHLEKLCLIDSGVGRDRISDFTTRLILDFLCDYTQTFARSHLDASQRRVFGVQRVTFDYRVEAWLPKQFELPSFNGDFVLLTPMDLLTRDDTWISRKDLFADFARIPEAIQNETLRAQINSYFLDQLPKEPTKEEVAKAIDATIHQFPKVIDYYIRYKEDHKEEARQTSRRHVRYSEKVFLDNASALAFSLAQTPFYGTPDNTFDECLERVNYLKHVVEERDGYRLFYVDGHPIEREEDLHVMFDLVWYGSPSDVNRETNNGRGPADFVVSRGANDKTVVEFKLAGNSQLRRNLKNQTEIYVAASRAQAAIKVVLYFSEQQESRVKSILKDLGKESAVNVVLIDARDDNKPSASKT